MTFVFGKAGEGIEPSDDNVQPEPFLHKVGHAVAWLLPQKEKEKQSATA